MSFFLKDDNVPDKYNKIWSVIKNKLKLNFIACLFMIKHT